jgi:hypothetical protein
VSAEVKLQEYTTKEQIEFFDRLRSGDDTVHEEARAERRAGGPSEPGMKRTITPEMLKAGTQFIRIMYYQLRQTMPEGFDLEGCARKLFAAPDSEEKRFFLRFVRKNIKSHQAEQAAEAAGLYSPSRLYAAFCDLSEHLMAHGRNLGKKKYPKYRTPAICFTSNEARAASNDIVAVVKRVTGFDLMDPAGSLKRLQKKAVRS